MMRLYYCKDIFYWLEFIFIYKVIRREALLFFDSQNHLNLHNNYVFNLITMFQSHFMVIVLIFFFRKSH